MFHIFSLPTIEILIRHYGYFIFFPISIAEGPIVTVIASFLASFGYLNVFIIYILAILGDVVGDAIYYLIGYLGKNRLLKGKKILWISKEKIIGIENHFENHSIKTLFFGKITHGAGFAILIAAGVAKMPFKKFIWYNFLGTVPKTLIFVTIGYFFGKSYTLINDYLFYISTILFIIISLCFVGYIIYKKRKNA